MQPIQIFKPGSFRPMQGEAIRFSETDLAACAAAYDPARHEAPIVIGHPATDAPAWGWVKSLKFSDGVLLAEPSQVNPAFADQVKAGAYKKVSASFWRPDAPGNPTPGSWALRHVGFLGAQPPALKGLAPIQFAGPAEGVVDFGAAWVGSGRQAAFAEEAWGFGALKRLFQGLRDRMIEKDGLDAADRTLPAYEIDSIAAAEQAEREEALSEGAPDPLASPMPGFLDSTKSKELALTTQNTGPSAADLAAQAADLAAREQALASQEAVFRATQNAVFADELISQGRLTPGQKADVVQLMSALTASPIANFAEGGPSPVAVFQDFLKSLPQAVDFAERAGGGAGTDVADPVAIAAAAGRKMQEARAAGRHMNAADAVAAVTKEG